jgi:hypothetical protein
MVDQRSGKDRRKTHTFILDDRRTGPFCRRRAYAMLKEGENSRTRVAAKKKAWAFWAPLFKEIVFLDITC